MLPKSIDAALLALRAQIVRESLDGLEHVEALLILRGVDPALHRVKSKKLPGSCRQREARVIILDALRLGPKTPAQIGDYFMTAKPNVAADRTMIRVRLSIYRMRDRGLIVKDGDAWRLV